MRFFCWLLPLLCNANLATAGTQVEADRALEMLNNQEKQFKQQVVKVTERVYTAVGYHGANTSMIVGDDGLIIVDTLMGPTSAANALQAFREYSDKPVKAIIYTHSHGDHTGGAAAFAEDNNPAIYAMTGFGSANGVDKALNPIMMPRGIRQFGRKLPPEEVTNRGLAPAKTIDHDRGKGHLTPNNWVTKDGLNLSIAGVKIEIVASPGETDDALFVWLPEEKVLFAGDNFYQAFPNLYAIRGTGYRNVLNWADSVAHMASFKPSSLVPGHTIPIMGQQAATSALQNYSDAIRSVYQQTVDGMNQGKSPNLIAHEVSLPEHLRDKPYLTEFYGTVPNAVRAIYAGLLGWYDGNPTTLNPLGPKAQAEKMAALAGGTKQLAKTMHQAVADEEYQWALELADQLIWLDDSDKAKVRAAKIKALRGLGAREYNAPNRNYYLSYANELEAEKLNGNWF